MVRLCVSATLSAVLMYAGYPYAGAVVLSATPSNQSSSRVNAGSAVDAPPDRLETSQTRVERVNERPASTDDHGVTGKDYDGRYPVHNTYGPPRDDYYYDEKPTDHRFRPSQAGYRPPSDEVYHQYPSHVPEHHHHHHHQYFQQHHGDGDGGDGYRPGELNIQPLLLPLAGITLLSVLSALVKAPLLLHLGTVGRRRRRDAVTVRGRDFTAQTIGSLLKQFGDRERRHVNPQSCLVCDIITSIYDRNSSCVGRSVCEVISRKGSGGVNADRQLLSAMIAQIVENDQIPEEIRKRLKTAEASGRNAENCGQLYPCVSDDGVPGKKRK